MPRIVCNDDYSNDEKRHFHVPVVYRIVLYLCCVCLAYCSGFAQSGAGGSGNSGGTKITISFALVTITSGPPPNGAVNVPYNFQFKASGGTGSYTWSIIAGALPGGVTLNANSGVISGTPTTPQSAGFTIQAQDTQSTTVSTPYTIVIAAAPLVVTNGSPPGGQVGVAYGPFNFTASGGVAPYTWAVTSGSLAGQLSLASNGTLTGTPVTAQTLTFKVTVTDANSTQTVSPTYTAVIAPAVALSITSGQPPDGSVGTAYSFQFSATGGTGIGYAWSVIAGALPVGVTLTSGGLMAGTPTTVSTPSFTVQVQDSGSNTASAPYSITIHASQLVVTNGSPPNGQVGVAYGPFSFTASGGVAPYTWTLFSGGFGGQISLSTGGVLSGTPNTAQTLTFRVRVMDSVGSTETSPTYTVVIAPAAGITITSGTPPGGAVNAAYSFKFTATGGTGTYTWSVIAGALPAGLTLSSGGLLSGTPTTPQTASFTIQAHDTGSGSTSSPYSITIAPAALVITNGGPPGGQVSVAYGPFAFTASGGVAPYTWAVTSGTLNSQLTLSSGGVLSGTPTSAQTLTFKVTVTDSNTTSLQSPTYTVVIGAAPSLTITSAPPPNGTVGVAYGPFSFTATGGAPPYAWVFTGTAPPGLMVNPSSGIMTGTPTTAGTYSSFSIQVTDQNSTTVSQPLTVQIVSPPSTTVITLPQAAVNSHECDTAVTAPAVTYHIKSDGTGDFPWTCAGIQSAINAWAADTDRPYLVIIDPGALPAVAGTCFNLTPKAVATQNGCLAMESSSPPARNQTPCVGAQGVNGTRNNGCPANLANFWQVQTSAINSNVIDTNNAVDGSGNGPHYFLLQDFAASPTSSVTTANAPLRLGTGAETTIAQLPSHIHAQYFYIHGDASDTFTPGSAPGNNIVANGATFNCPFCSLMWFQMDKLLRLGSEGHGIAIAQNTGPYKITNAWIEGESSGVFHGGQTPSIPGIVSAYDGEERNLRLTYPAAWIGANFGAASAVRKNAWELKEGQRILVDGVIFENVDQSGGQGGPCMGMDTRACSAGQPCDNYVANITNILISNFIMRGCLGLQNDARSGGGTAGISVSGGAGPVEYLNGLIYNMPASVYCQGGNGNGGSACAPYRIPGLISSGSIFTGTGTRSGVNGNITLALIDAGTGQHQTQINVGDPLSVQGCADASFNIPLGAISALALAGTTPNGLTVVYNNGSSGAGSTTGCQVFNRIGFWNGFIFRHVTVVAQTGVSGSTFGPNQGSCPITTTSAAYMRQSQFVDNLWAIDQWSGFGGNGSAEGSSGLKPAENCFDLSTFQLHHDAFAERNGANYTAYPSGLKGNVAGSNLWFPSAIPCPSGAPTINCFGFSGMVNGAAFNQNPADYHSFELCGGSGSPGGCPGNSVFAAGGSQQASDGTDAGANIPAIDAAQSLNLYLCSTPCGAGFYPNAGNVVIVDPAGSDSNNGTALTPVATLNGARALVAGVDGSLIQFDSGLYPNTSTTFAGSDSGTAALPITYHCGTAPCTLSGGVKVTGWVNCDGVTHCKNIPAGAFSCSGCQTPVFVSLSSSSFTNFEQLWYNGVRRYRPRSPYTDPSTGIGTWYLQGTPGGSLHQTCASSSSSFFPEVGGCPSTGGNNFECFGCYQRDAGDTQTVFHGLSQFSPADDCTAPGTAPGIHDVEIVAMENWTNSRMRLCNKIADGTNTFALTSTQLPATGLTTSGASGTPPSATCGGTCSFGPLAGHNYFLDNVLESMIHKQQWYLDRCPSSPTCASGVESTWELIYIPATGETPTSDTIVIPQIQAPIINNSANNLAFDGLTIANSNVVTPAAGLPGQTDSPNISAGVSFRIATGITLRNMTIQNMGGWGLEFVGAPGLQTAITNQWINSTIFDTGSGGVRVGAQETTGDTAANVAQFVKLQNIFCKGIQRFMASEAGCFSVQNAHDNLVTQTSARDTYNLAYTHGGSQGFAGLGHIQANNNTFSFIEGDTVGQGVTSDDSAFHSHSGSGTGNSLQYFIFHDVVQGVESNSFFTSYNGYSGPYLDNSTSFFTVGPGLSYNGSEGNLLVNSAADGLGTGNVITNVILAYGRSGLVKRGNSNFTLTNSIGYFDKGNSMNGVQYEGGSQWVCGSLPCSWTFNQNTWFNFVNTLGTGSPWYTTVTGSRVYVSSSQWCSMFNEDCSSTFTTNPGFVTPTCAGGYNFNFSGAIPSTFTPFMLAEVGSTMPEPPVVPAAFPTFVPNCNTYY